MNRVRSIVFFFSGFLLFCFSCQVVWSQDVVSAWGRNDYGQLGDGTYSYDSNTPVRVSGLTGIRAIAGGGLHSLALKSDGTVWAWGRNNYGQLGDLTFTTTSVPVQVVGLSNMTVIAAGFDHTLALERNGTVWAWGRNDYGQLGDGTNATTNGPVPVSGLFGIRAIAGGGLHSLALKSDGTVWAWGYNLLGQLGNGTYTTSNTPVQVSGLTNVIAIAGGYFHNLALKSDGTVWTWGWNYYGQLGDGTYSYDSNTPVQVSGLTGMIALAGGGSHSLALRSDGRVWAWGSNDVGQLGNGGTNTTSNTPVPVSGLIGVTVIAGGEFHSLALKSDGTVWAWGRNDRGQLGDGTNPPIVSTNTPVQVSGLTGQAAIAGGEHHSLALNGLSQVTPEQAINNLIVQVKNWSLGVLPPAQTKSLTAMLDDALEHLQQGNEADAIDALYDFENKVKALVLSHRVTAAAAAPLLSAADSIIAMLIAML